jgi:hypothetical protein
MPRYVETPIEVPEFTTIEEAEAFLLTLSQRVGVGELSIDATNQVTAIIQAWISSKRQGQELDLKIQAASATGDHVIRIEGGLPPLPGTNVIMPTIEVMGKLGPDDTARTRPRCWLLSTIRHRLVLPTRPNDPRSPLFKRHHSFVNHLLCPVK